MNVATHLPTSNPFGRLFRFLLKLIPESTVMKVMGGPLRGSAWVKGAYVNGCWLGTYEQEKVDLFVKHLKQGQVFWDIGSNTGYYALIAARYTQKEVYAFEPLPRNLEYLNRHVKLNKAMVTVFPFALGAADGEALFDTGSSVGNGRITTHNSSDSLIKVSVRSFPSLIKQGLLKPDIIKMDIEGAEELVLPMLLEELPGRGPIIFLAVHGESCRSSCLKALRSHNYTIRPLDEQSIEHAHELLCLPG